MEKFDLHSYMKEHNLTIKDVGKKLNIRSNNFSNLLLGRRTLNIDKIERLTDSEYHLISKDKVPVEIDPFDKLYDIIATLYKLTDSEYKKKISLIWKLLQDKD